MAAYKGVNQTLVEAGGIATIGAGLINGKLHVCADHYTVDATQTTGDTLALFGALPKGAKIISISFVTTATQAATTLNVGDAHTAARYASGIILTVGTTGTWAQVYAGKEYVIGTATTADDTQILLTLAGGATTAATWYAWIMYTTD